MTQDVSRTTFDPTKNYDRVVFNQKRSLLDAELNESQEILAEMSSMLAKMGVGDGAIGDGFKVFTSLNQNEVVVRDGIFYHQGSFLRLSSPIALSNLTTPTTGNRIDIVYIDYKFVAIDSTTDSNIIDPAVGAETATRRQIQIELKVAEGVALPTVDWVTEFIVPIAQLNRQNLNPNVSTSQIQDLRLQAARNYIESGLAIGTLGTNQVQWEAGWGVVGNNKFTIQSGSTIIANTAIPKKWFINSSSQLTFGDSWPSTFHVKVAETFIDPVYGIWTSKDLRRFIPLVGLPIDFPITMLGANPLGTQITFQNGLVYVDGTDYIRFPETTINLGVGGDHQLSAITPNRYRKVLISLRKFNSGDSFSDLLIITEGPIVVNRPDADTANPDAPDDHLPLIQITVQDDGQGVPGSIKSIVLEDVEDIRPFLNLGSSNEVVTARGTRASLNDRLSQSLEVDGSLVPNSVNIDIIRDLRAEPTTGQDPLYPTPSRRVYIKPGIYNFGRFSQVWQGGVSDEIPTPAPSQHRIDLIVLNEDGTLTRYQGNEINVSLPAVAPSHAGLFPVAEIYTRYNISTIEEVTSTVSFAIPAGPNTSFADTSSLITTDDQYTGETVYFTSGDLTGRTFNILDTTLSPYHFTLEGDATGASGGDRFIISPIKRVRPINRIPGFQSVPPQRYLWTVASGGDINNTGHVSGGIPIPLLGKVVTVPFKYLVGGYELQVYRNGVKLIINVDYTEVVVIGSAKSTQITLLNSAITFLPDGDQLEFIIIAGAQPDYAPGINPPQRDVQIAIVGQTVFSLPFDYLVGSAANSYEQQLLVFVDGAKRTRKDAGDPDTTSLTVFYLETTTTSVTFTPPMTGGEIVEFLIPAGSLATAFDAGSNWDNLGTKLRPKQNQGIELSNINVGIPDIRGTSNTWSVSRTGDATFNTINGQDPAGILTVAAKNVLEGGPNSIADGYHTHAGLASGARTFHTPPNFDSGWVNVPGGNTVFTFATLDPDHTLQLNPQKWITVIEGAGDSLGTLVNNKQIGLEDNGGNQLGFAYHTVISSSITVQRGLNDVDHPYIRVRIWDYSTGPISTNSKQSLVLDYDAGWLPINPGQSLTLTHDIGLEVLNGVLVLEGSAFSDGTSPHINALGFNERSNGQVWGAQWSALNSTTVAVTRGSGDGSAPAAFRWNYFRLRIYTYQFLSVAPSGGQLGMGKPGFDSGWLNRFTGNLDFATYDPTNTLGGDPDNFVIDIQLRDTSGIVGRHQRGVGGDLNSSNTILYPYYTGLTGLKLAIVCPPDDGSIIYDQFRVRIWDTSKGVATPNSSEALVLKYDSSWTNILIGQTLTFNHNIGEDVDTYVVDLTYRDDLGNINQQYYGTDTDDSGVIKGIYWQNSTNNSINVTRAAFDTVASQCRVRIFRLEQIAAVYPIARLGTFYPQFFHSIGVAPTLAMVGGMTPAWLFAAGNEFNFRLDLPADVNLAQPLTLNLHWTAVSNASPGVSEMALTYQIINPGVNVSAGISGVDSVTITPSLDLTGNDTHEVISNITVPGTFITEFDSLISFKLKRNITGSDYVPAFYVLAISLTYHKVE